MAAIPTFFASLAAVALSSARVAAQNEPQLMIPVGHIGQVKDAEFSPNGKRIVTAAEDGTARIWDVRTGRELLQLGGLGEGAETASYSPDGRRIVVTSYKGAKVRDASTGRLVLWLKGHEKYSRCAAFSPDGTKILSCFGEPSVRVWDAGTGRANKLLTGAPERVATASFSPDGQEVIAELFDGSACVWSTTTGAVRLVLPRRSGNSVVYRFPTPAFSADGKRLLTANKTTSLWDASSGKELLEIKGPGHFDTASGANLSPDGRSILTVQVDGWNVGSISAAFIWDASTGKELMRLNVPGSKRRIVSATYSPDGSRIETTLCDGTCLVWSAKTGRQLAKLMSDGEEVSRATFSPDGKLLFTSWVFGTARMFDGTRGIEAYQLSLDDYFGDIGAISPDGRRIATYTKDDRIVFRDSRSGIALLTFGDGRSFIRTAEFSSDGTRLVTTSDHGVNIWNALTGEDTAPTAIYNGFSARSAAYSPDGKRVVISSDIQNSPNRLMATILDATTGAVLARLEGEANGLRVNSAAFSPDGARVITGSEDHTVRIWDASSGKQLRLLTGAQDSISRVEFSPNGRRMLAASNDGTARVWDVASGKQLLQLGTLLPNFFPYTHSSEMGAAFSPDGERIVTASYDEKVRFWDAKTGKLLGTIYPLRTLGWAATTPDGWYDGTPKALAAMYYVVPKSLKTYNLAHNRNRRRKIGLLSALIFGRKLR